MEICDLLKIGLNQLLVKLCTIKKYTISHNINDLILYSSVRVI